MRLHRAEPALPSRARVWLGRANVVDVSGYGLGAPLAALLSAAGSPAACATEAAVHEADGLVLVLPVRSEETLPETSELWFRIGRAAADATGSRGPAWVVMVWAVRAGERPVFATPFDGGDDAAEERRRGGFNAAPLVIGAGWRRELARHGGVAAAAVACRSAQVRRLLAAGSHGRIAGTDTRRMLADIVRIDPDARHTLLVEVRPGAAAAERRWADVAGVAAAVAAGRGGQPPTAR